MNGSLPSEARERVLAGLSPEKRLDVLERSDKRGPRPNDPDWLLVETVMAAVADVKGATAEAVAAMQSAAPFGPEALAAIESAAAKGGQSAVSAEQLKEMAADLRAIRGRVGSAQAPSRWWMFGMFFAGLVVAFTCAAILHFAGHRPQGQIWIASDGLARLSEVLVFVTAVCAGVTWWATRR
jgi:hypothetical protein